MSTEGVRKDNRHLQNAIKKHMLSLIDPELKKCDDQSNKLGNILQGLVEHLLIMSGLAEGTDKVNKQIVFNIIYQIYLEDEISCIFFYNAPTAPVQGRSVDVNHLEIYKEDR